MSGETTQFKDHYAPFSTTAATRTRATYGTESRELKATCRGSLSDGYPCAAWALPSKKNLWKHGKGERTYIDSDTQALIDALTKQAREQWKYLPVTHPWMSVQCVQFFTRDRRHDRDNLLTTLLDCLRKAGVIVNDNIKSFNGSLILLLAVIDKNGRVNIEVIA